VKIMILLMIFAKNYILIDCYVIEYVCMLVFMKVIMFLCEVWLSCVLLASLVWNGWLVMNDMLMNWIYDYVGEVVNEEQLSVKFCFG